MSVRRLVPLVVALWLALALQPVQALDPSEMLKDPSLESRARALSAELRCLVCQNQSIDESEAPLAKDLRVLIRERLLAGDSDAAIMDFVVARYGEFVLLKPRFSPATALLWLGPFLILAAGTAFILLRRRKPEMSQAEQALSAEEKARLESHPPAA